MKLSHIVGIAAAAGIIGIFFSRRGIVAPNYLHRAELPRGLKNNNPLNIIKTNIEWTGKIPNNENTDGAFEQFKNIGYGYRAAARNLQTYYGAGKNTIRALIRDWNEGDDTNYVNFVSNSVGISPDTPINLAAVIVPIIRAMAIFENGVAFAGYIETRHIENAVKAA